MEMPLRTLEHTSHRGSLSGDLSGLRIGNGMVSSHPLLLAALSSPVFAPDKESLQLISL